MLQSECQHFAHLSKPSALHSDFHFESCEVPWNNVFLGEDSVKLIILNTVEGIYPVPQFPFFFLYKVYFPLRMGREKEKGKG